MRSPENRRQLDELQNYLEGDWTREDGASEFQSSDGIQLIKVKLLSRGVRDRHAALIQIALLTQERPELTRAYLIAPLLRMTPQRAQEEWQRAVEILRVDTAKRLAFIGISGDAAVLLPDDLAARQRAFSATQALRQAGRQGAVTSSRMSIVSFQVWKVLLRAWLSREGAPRVAEIAKRAGCSYPTVAKTLDRLQQRGELLRATGRSVTLQGFPRASLREVLVLAESLRRPIPFVDVAGAESRSQSLLRRLQEHPPPKPERRHMNELNGPIGPSRRSPAREHPRSRRLLRHHRAPLRRRLSPRPAHWSLTPGALSSYGGESCRR